MKCLLIFLLFPVIARAQVTDTAHKILWDVSFEMHSYHHKNGDIDRERTYGVTAVTADANYTSVADAVVILNVNITAGRNFVLPTGVTGKELKIWNKNTTGNAWTFTNGTVKDAASSTISTMTNSTWYTLMFDGTNWIKEN